MKDKPNKLDEMIRAKLTGLGAAYRPETWHRLSDRLDELDESGAGSLDEVVRQKMAGLTVPYRPESWDWLSERLDGLEAGTPAGAEMQSLEEAVYERMHRLEKPYDPNHWPLLLKKLEANAYVGRQIVRYKAMELSLLLLLLITFIRMPLPTAPHHPLPAEPAPQVRPQAQVVVPSAGQASDLAAAGLNQQAAGQTGHVAASAAAPKEHGHPAPADYRDAAAGPAVDIAGADAAVALPGLTRLPARMRELPSAQKQDLPAPVQHPLTAKAEAPALGIHTGSVFGLMTYLPTSLIHPWCQTCIGKLDRAAMAAKQPTYFRIGMQGGPDYNRVLTPPTLIGGRVYRDDRYALGYSGGLTFALEKDRWELETGLIYSNKRYYSLPVVVVDGSVEEGFYGNGTKQIDLDVFEAPLNFRYNFIRKNRWRVYALAGMSLHVTTQSNYYLGEPDDFGSGPLRPQPTRPGQENHGRNAPSIKAEFDNFTKGWLEGGAFSKNSYLTGNLGAGVERFITDYWSIYAQPTYRHSLLYLNDGLGPYYDRIHTNSLIFGVKVRLK